MSSVKSIAELEANIERILAEATSFFRDCKADMDDAPHDFQLTEHFAWRARLVAEGMNPALVTAASLIRNSSILDKVDLQAVQLALRRSNAALRLRAFEEWGPSVLHDEGT